MRRKLICLWWSHFSNQTLPIFLKVDINWDDTVYAKGLVVIALTDGDALAWNQQIIYKENAFMLMDLGQLKNEV